MKSDSQTSRYLISIDILRASAILLMIQVHFVTNLSPRASASAALYDLSTILGMLPAPIFSFLTGFSLWLWLGRETQRGIPEARLRRTTFRRVVFLFVSGLAFATFIWLPVSVFDWDILTFLGAATIIVYLFRNLSPRWIFTTIIFVLLVSPWLRSTSGYAAHWQGSEYLYDFTVRDVVMGFLLEGYFPLLPWISFSLLGLAFGKYYSSSTDNGQFTGWALPAAGLILIGYALTGGLLLPSGNSFWEAYLGEITFYPASTTFVIAAMGIVILAFWGLYRHFDSGQKPRDGLALPFWRRYSRFSLTVYIVHHAVHVWPLYLLAIWEGRNDIWWYYGDAISTPVALLLAVIFIVLFYGSLIFWEKKRKYSFEGALRWFSEA
ncbi:MAG: DUF1624 domain-containing protein [Anaerolineales bacterium]|nr:DUF1624 domain-containing protein [Anaerolineales bacterium]